MIALLVSLTGALGIAVASWLPGLLGTDSGVDAVTPGLLTVESEAAGVITLGEGRSVSLDAGGLTISDGSDILFRTVRSGSLMSALTGELREDDPYREQVEQTLSNLTIRSVDVDPGSARYLGSVSSGETQMPVIITVTYAGDRVVLTAEADGADAVVLHGYQEPAARGLAPTLPDESLWRRAWWIDADVPGEQQVMTSGPHGALAIGPSGSVRAADLRQRGHTDLHAWAASLELTMAAAATPDDPGGGDG